MTITSPAALSETLRQFHLLDPPQLEQLPALPGDAKESARELVRRGWLTAYQVNQLFQGRGQDLLLGSYVLLSRLGEGGMGQVFVARNWKLGQVVALKLIRKERLANPDAVRRFHREIRAAARLSHPNVVHALDADEVNGTHFFAMEYVEGTDLSRLVKQHGPLPIADACDYVRQAALGLQHAHEHGLVHRDVKPANLLLTKAGVVKVLDMGLARLGRESEDDEASSTMTREGAVMGTLDYIAPEQSMDSHSVDIRADLYSLGCTLYYLLSGRVPFPGGEAMQKLMKHRFDEPVAVEKRRPGVPPAVAAVVRRLMAKRPEDRYQTPAELASALALDAATLSKASARPPLPPADDAAYAQTVPLVARVAAPIHPANPFELSSTVLSRRQPAKGRPLILLAGGGVALLLVLLALSPLFFAGRGRRERGTAPETKPPADDGKKKDDAPKDKDKGPPKSQPTELPKSFTNSIGMRFVRIPKGTFLMGSPEGEEDHSALERRHEVELTRDFYLGVTEVTQKQYRQVMGTNPSSYRRDGINSAMVKDLGGEELGDFPVSDVSWEDAQAFIEKLNALAEERGAGRRYRLPTEAEWEYACRAGTTTKYHFGNSIGPTLANMGGGDKDRLKGALGRPCKVGSYAPNAVGLYDMHGNVWEWCSDWFGEKTYSDKNRKDPQGPQKGERRVFRGGSWGNVGRFCRSAYRNNITPAWVAGDVGFRVVCVIRQE